MCYWICSFYIKNISCNKLKDLIYFNLLIRGLIMQDSETIKYGALFIFGIGFVVFVLGVAAAVFFN